MLGNLTGIGRTEEGAVRRVVIVNDDPAVRAILRGCLDGAGYRVTEVEDGERHRLDCGGMIADSASSSSAPTRAARPSIPGRRMSIGTTSIAWSRTICTAATPVAATGTRCPRRSSNVFPTTVGGHVVQDDHGAGGNQAAEKLPCRARGRA